MGIFRQTYGKEDVFSTTAMTFVQAAAFVDGPDSDISLPHDGLLDSVFFAIDSLDTYSSGIFKDPQLRFHWYEAFLVQSSASGYVLPHERGLKLKPPKPLATQPEQLIRDMLKIMRDTDSQEQAQTHGIYVARLLNILNKSKVQDKSKLIKKLQSDWSDLDDNIVAVAGVLAPAVYTCGKETSMLNKKESKFKLETTVDFAIFFARTYFRNFAN